MTAKPSPAPAQIDKYVVLRQLGAGAMGSVYEARHKGTGRRVAVKLINEEAVQGPGVVERFQREARAAGVIESEHITQVLDSGTDPVSGAPFLVMELLAGEDLGALAERLRPMRPELALRIVAQALRGLESAHVANVVHRDIKPPNMFLARKESGEYVVKLCDFGIAKVSADPLGSSQNIALTHTSALLGSPGYMSPEQVKGAKGLDRRTDLWSMGVVLYELLVGAPPYPEADTLGLILLAICSDPPAAVQEHAPWVPAECEAIVKRAMQTDRAKRFQTAEEMLAAVMELLPDGAAVTESMLAPMTDEELGFVAPRPSVVISSGGVPASVVARTVAAASRADALPLGTLAAEAPGGTLVAEAPGGTLVADAPRAGSEVTARARTGDDDAGRGKTSRRAVAGVAAAVAALAVVVVTAFALRSGEGREPVVTDDSTHAATVESASSASAQGSAPAESTASASARGFAAEGAPPSDARPLGGDAVRLASPGAASVAEAPTATAPSALAGAPPKKPTHHGATSRAATSASASLVAASAGTSPGATAHPAASPGVTARPAVSAAATARPPPSNSTGSISREFN